MLAEAQPSWATVATLAVTTTGTVLLAWIALKTKQQSETIKKLETNTNSIKDALVKTVAESEHAKGMLQGQKDEKAIEALKAVGALEAVKSHVGLAGLAGVAAAPIHDMPAIQSLVKIETNTAKIEENTARTDQSTARTEEAVDKLKNKAK